MAESRPLNSVDILLRRHGFGIASRPRVGEPTWSRGRLTFRQSAALAIVAGERKLAATLSTTSVSTSTSGK